jgi:hypothetical protein
MARVESSICVYSAQAKTLTLSILAMKHGAFMEGYFVEFLIVK